MKNIEIDEDLYQYIAQNTQFIGESASAILRRLLSFDASAVTATPTVAATRTVSAKASDGDKVFNYINKEELAMQRGAVGRFLLILAALYRANQAEFSVVSSIRGRDRLYFAANEADLEASGSSTKPRQIPDSPFWVITNSNTTRKKMMLTEVATELGYNETDVEKIRDLL